MLKKWLCGFVFLMVLLSALPMECVVWASDAVPGEGSWGRPYVVTDAEQLTAVLGASGSETVYIRLGADIFTDERQTMNVANVLNAVAVQGKKSLDLCGYKVMAKLPFNASMSSYSLFVIGAGASLTVKDSAGGGEIVYDRYIPAMGEVNEQTEIFLDRPLTVFEVSGTLKVNGGEITAGHYEHEYYTFTDGYIYADSQPSPGYVNSITPGNAVVVNSGGSFISNGGEFYGRGFTMDDNGDKETACAAVRLNLGANAVINAGEFYGKSNADVVSVNDSASITVMSGRFEAQYDNRITVDKTNGTAYYVNVDCGRIGVPLRAFCNGREEVTHIYVDGVEHFYTSGDDEQFINLGTSGTGVTVTVEALGGNGTAAYPYEVKYGSDLTTLLLQDGLSRVYLRMESDIEDFLGPHTVTGNVVLDLNGHTVKGKLGWGIHYSSDSLFIVESGSSFTLEDSAGDGEIIYDRRIPTLSEVSAESDLILSHPLTVIEVNGNLTVNGGEITAGHHESEPYTYTQKYNTGGSTSPETVNSVTPGSAVVVRDGGRFTSNGGKYSGRGFTIDENGEKDFVCAAVRLENGAAAVINAGEFYGQSNADVFSVAWGANAYVNFGYFEAQYHNHVTVDKRNGIAYYVNVDCGRIGLPLRSFTHAGADRRVIKIGPDPYPFSLSFTSAESSEFENLGSEGEGADVTVSPCENGVSQIVREDGINAGLTYSPTDHFELIHEGAQYYRESFAPLPDAPYHVMSYYWKVTRLGSAGWEDVGYEPGAPVSNNYYLTDTNRLDLYELARDLRGGMTQGSTYRVEAHASEYWAPSGEVIYTVSGDVIEIDCVYERLGAISLPDSVTGIQWPEHGKSPVNLSVEQETFTAFLTFEERNADGTRYAPMSGSSTFARGGFYRLKVQITPKPYYRADPGDSVTVGGKAVTDLTVSRGVLTGYIDPLDVHPSPIASVPVRGNLSEGAELSAASPLNSPIPGVVVSTVWYKNGAPFTGTATQGEYRALVTVTTRDPNIFTAATKVTVMGKTYPIANLSSDGLTGSVLTDPQQLGCTHRGNTNGYSHDADSHWMICSVCGAELSRGTHTFGSWTHQGGVDVRKCSVCSYEESVSNGWEAVPYIRLTGGVPMVGDPIPVLAVCEADARYGTLEHEAEWFIDEVDYKNSIPAGTAMVAGHTYYAFVKFNVSDGYYFTDDTEVATLNHNAATPQDVYGSWSHLEAILAFTPNQSMDAQIVLGDLAPGRTWGEALEGFDAAIGGVPASYILSIRKNGSIEAVLSYDTENDSWWIASGSVGEFMARTLESDTDYRIDVTLSETGTVFDPDRISIGNTGAACRVETDVSSIGCTVTAYYRLCTVQFAGASITLQNNLKENFHIEKDLITGGGYTDLRVVFEMNGQKITVSDCQEDVCDGKTYLVFSLPNIAPNLMNDLVTATFHAEKDGKECVSAPVTYSIASYCYSMLESTESASLRTLLVDLLNYGTAAQIYTGYRTDTPANGRLTAEQRGWGTTADPVLISATNTAFRTVESPAVVWVGASLRLNNSVTMQFVFTAADTDGVTIRVENGSGALLGEIAAQAFTQVGSYKVAAFSGLTAKQMREVVYVTAYRGETPISNTIAYSIESYAFAKQNDADANLAALVTAMMKYGDAAYAYADAH